VGLAPPIVIPAKAGIQIPYFTVEEIFAETQKLALDSGFLVRRSLGEGGFRTLMSAPFLPSSNFSSL